MGRIKKFLALIFVMLVLISSNSFAESQSIPSPISQPRSTAKPDSVVKPLTDGSKEDPQKIIIYILGQSSILKSSNPLRTDLVFINGVLITGLAKNFYIHYETNELKTKVSTYAEFSADTMQLYVYSDYTINAKPDETYYLMIKNNIHRDLTLLTKEEGETDLKKYTEQNY